MKLSMVLGCILALTGMETANAAVTISGTVKDTLGNALDSIRVSLQVGGSASFARDTTSTDGVFSISSDSTTGKLILKSMSIGSTSYTTKYDTLVLSGADLPGLAIKLVAVPAPVKSSVSGKVDSAGTATVISGAIVTLRSSGIGGAATTLLDTTGADGTYSFASVTTGTYTLSVSAAGYTTKNVNDTVAATPNTVNVSLVAPILSSVSGKVDSAGTATVISGAIVTLRSSGAGGAMLRDTTGADGTYSFAGVTTGTYTIGVSATGYTTKNVNDTVTAAPNTANVSLVAIVTSTVSGKVDSAGTATAISGAIVTLRSSGIGAAVLRDTTGADGTYSFAGVTAGTYTIGVSATGYTTKNVNDTVTAAPNTANVSLVAIVVSTVSGKVDSAATATAIGGAIVTLRSSGAGGAVATLLDTTGADGTYSFANVAAGTYTISVSATGYTTKSANDTVTAAPNTVNVSLVAIVVSSVSGKVDSAGTATVISGAIVTLRGTGAGAAVLRDTTGADGTYSFANVTAGAYTIGVSATGYTTKNVNDTVTAAPNTVNVSLAATVISTVGGKVDSAGTATVISGAIVTLRSTGAGGAMLRDTTGADGTYSFANVTAGAYTIGVSATGYTTKNVNDTVTAAPNTVNVSLVATIPPKTITISGTVSDTTGKKLDSVLVALRSVGTTGAPASTLLRDTTGIGGAFSFSSTYVSGKYVLRLITMRAPADTLIDTISLDSANFNVDLVWKKTKATGVRKAPTNTNPEVSFVNGILTFSNMNSAGSVRLFNAQGALMMIQSFQPGARINMRVEKKLSKGNYTLSISQKNAVIQKQIVVQ